MSNLLMDNEKFLQCDLPQEDSNRLNRANKEMNKWGYELFWLTVEIQIIRLIDYVIHV